MQFSTQITHCPCIQCTAGGHHLNTITTIPLTLYSFLLIRLSKDLSILTTPFKDQWLSILTMLSKDNDSAFLQYHPKIMTQHLYKVIQRSVTQLFYKVIQRSMTQHSYKVIKRSMTLHSSKILICKQLGGQNVSKATGPDEISARIMKAIYTFCTWGYIYTEVNHTIYMYEEGPPLMYI